MRTQSTFPIFADPGHAWCKVPLAMLYKLGIQDQITYFSHQRGSFAYLEEDLDLSLFIKAFREYAGRDPAFRETHTNKYSKIRGYLPYACPNPPQKTI